MRLFLLISSLLATSLLAGGCLVEGRPLANTDQDVRFTFLHTSDWHSRLLPYEFEPPRSDEELGLASAHRPFGGLTRMATLLKRERAAAERVLHVDSGDCFQGAPIFNFYQGEVEIRSMSLAGVDAAVIGNHEFDAGIRNVTEQLRRHARYPVIGANYVLPDFIEGTRDIGLGDVVQPFTILNSGGLRVGVIGGANVSSLSSIGEGGSSLGIQPIDEVQAIQDWVKFLEPQVDLTILVSHMGLSEDERIIRATVGLDIVFGGHHHIVLNPPKVIEDAVGRPVPLVHSGAFMKYVGKLDVVVRSGSVISHDYTLFPIDSALWKDHCPDPSGPDRGDRQPFCPSPLELPPEKLAQPWLPDDAEALRMLEPYILDMNRNIDLKGVVAYSPQRVGRFGVTSGDSPLGNLVTDAMLRRERVEADFALTNSLGIRTDFHRGAVTLEQMFNVFPFENSITKVLLSGQEIVEMLDFVARRSAGRGCQSQAQVSGLTFRMNCVDQFTLSWSDLVYVGPPPCLAALDHGEGTKLDFPGLSAADVATCKGAVRKIVGKRGSRLDRCDITPLSFDAAVNDYIAGGGSGFEVLKFNTAKVHTGVSQRDAVVDHMRKLPACKTLSEEVVDDCITDLQTLFRRECRRLTGDDLARCTERATERADNRCRGDLPCVAGEADGRIGQVFVDSADVAPTCPDVDTTQQELIVEPDGAHDHAWGPDEACNG